MGCRDSLEAWPGGLPASSHCGGSGGGGAAPANTTQARRRRAHPAGAGTLHPAPAGGPGRPAAVQGHAGPQAGQRLQLRHLHRPGGGGGGWDRECRAPLVGCHLGSSRPALADLPARSTQHFEPRAGDGCSASGGWQADVSSEQPGLCAHTHSLALLTQLLTPPAASARHPHSSAQPGCDAAEGSAAERPAWLSAPPLAAPPVPQLPAPAACRPRAHPPFPPPPAGPSQDKVLALSCLGTGVIGLSNTFSPKKAMDRM